MQTKAEILIELKRILVELFEIEVDKITLQAALYEELDLDSIDAIDLVVKLQEITGKKMNPETFKSVRSVQDIVDAVYDLLNA